jgi:hypothetical protein
MGDLVQFVDSLDASPTVRLDLNDEGNFWVKRFDALPPRLRRSMASNAMRDGIHVGTSTYDARTLVIELECLKATQDEAATQIQALWRELDRANNWIKYQPNGLTKPVFFRTYRSDTSQLEDVIAQAAMRTFTIEVLAEPFALGLKESLGPYTVSNDPADVDGLTFTIPAASALGDVPAPLVVTTSTAALGLVLATGTPTIKQAEDEILMIDTTNPGGGPDAAMSGTGTNNYVRTSFSTTATMAERWETDAGFPGTFRVFAYVRRTDSTSVFNVRALSAMSGPPPGTTVALPLTTERRLVNLGIVTIGTPGRTTGYGEASSSGVSPSLRIEAERVSGSGSIDWDAFIAVPIDDQMLIAQATRTTPRQHTVDGVTEAVFSHTAGDPIAGAGTLTSYDAVAGSLPLVAPDQDNVYTLLYLAGEESNTVTSSVDATVSYWPRYLFIRPASS